MTESRKSQKNRLFEIFAAIILLIFAAGIIQLFLWRFERGDIYPFYSSLRSDPLGAKVLYESLQKCCGLKVWRNYEPFNKIKGKQNAALFFIGEQAPQSNLMQKDLFNDLETFLQNGGRLIVTYLPVNAKSWSKQSVVEQPDNEDKKNWIAYTKLWGYTYNVQKNLKANLPAVRDPDAKDAGLPNKISYRTALYFKNPDSTWRVVYRNQGLPVVIEKRFGKGTLVLSALTYFLSNEAMLRERHPGMILWLAGGRREIIFDEYFHGTATDPGIAVLMRKYDLHFTIALLIVLAVLYIWKNAFPLVPVPESETRVAISSSLGKDSSAGLTNLLRRNLPAKMILPVCLQEWKKASSGRHPVSANKQARIDAIVAGAKTGKFDSRKVVDAYNQVSEVLKEK